MRNGIKLLLSLILLVCTQMLASAQAPANDSCANAASFDTLAVGVQSCLAGTNDFANAEFPYSQLAGCQPTGTTAMADSARDVWYTFTTAPNATELTVKINGTLPTINLGLYTGTCGSLNGVACGTATADSFSYTFRNLLGNTTYYLQVSGDTTTDTGSFTICLKNIVPPSNDSCVNAITFGTLTAGSSQCAVGSINYAGQENPFHSLTGCRPSNHPMSPTGGDVWYTFTTPAGGTKLHMQLTGTVDSVNIGLYTGSCSALSGVNCGVSYNGNFDYTFDQLQGNTTYYVQVEGQSIGDSGTFNLCLTSIIPPPNDACSGAINLGTLTVGSQSCVAGTNVNAGPEYPYPYQPFCFPGSATANPSSDVWYTFTTPAGSNQLAVSITGTLDTLNVAIYRGSCGSLVGIGCESATGGTYTHTFGQFAASTTYYIQVSGGSPTDQGTFNLCLTSGNNTSACINNGFVNVTPLPTNGTYGAGQTVQFCYTITSYNQLSANWLHGITIIPGAGWDPTSFTTVSIPASCDGQGVWGYYATDVSTATGQVFGPGFFYDSPAGSTSGVLDGIPGNNYGDNCSSHTWTFCWTYTVKSGPCTSNSTDLSMTIRPSSDGMSGSWSSLQCTGDPASVTNLIRSCCPQPLLSAHAPTCPGQCNGSARATGQGTAPFSYHWSNGATTDSISGLCPGTYTVTVVDSTNCSVVASAIIGQPTLPTVNADSIDVRCNGDSSGIAFARVSSVVNSIQYAWNTVPPRYTDTITGLRPGTYTVTVTFPGGCTVVDSTVINEPTTLTSTHSSTPASCNGGADGSATVTPAGGVPPYRYSWNTSPVVHSSTLFNYPAGTYVVTITDTNGCTKIDSVTIDEPTPIVITTGSTNATCGATNADGTAWASATGGTGPYFYLWSYNFLGTDTITGLPAGNYTITVIDNNGCYNSATVAVGSGTSNLTAVVNTSDISCNGLTNGSANAIVSGGNGPFTYQWDYNNLTTDTITNLAAGTYNVTVTDSLGCVFAASGDVIEPDPILLNADSLDEICGNPGSVWVTVSGGTPGFTYNWNTTPVSTTDTVTGLPAGTYSVTVTDLGGCTATASTSINAGSGFQIQADSVNVSCPAGSNNGMAYVVVTGGTGPFTYLWSNQGTTDTITNLAPGVYIVTVTDGGGCSSVDSTTVTNFSSNITLVTSAIDVKCFGDSTGSEIVTATGQAPPFSYSWSNSAIDNDTISGVPAGTYTVTVTDDAGCINGATVTVAQPAQAVSVSLLADSASCNGSGNGKIVATANGGVPPYTYTWSTATATTDTAANLSAGGYLLTVTDNNGCTVTDSATVNEPAALTTAVTPQPIQCAGGNNGSAVVTASGGSAPYTYVWSTNDSTATVDSLAVGTYLVTITDNHLCSTVDSAVITAPVAITASVTQTTASCVNIPTGAISVDVSGGTAPLQYLWSNNDTTLNIAQQDSGVYTLTITDASSCTLTVTDTIGLVDFTVGIAVDPDTAVLAGESVTLTATGNDIASVSWHPGIWLNDSTLSTVIATPETTTVYHVVAISNIGCEATDSISITVENNSLWYMPDAFTPNGDGHNDRFNIFGRGPVEVVYLKIYNRWGKMIYSQDGGSPGWDGTYNGKELDQDTYVYYSEIKYTPPGGTTQTIQIKGAFTLLR